MALSYGNVVSRSSLGLLIDTTNPKCWSGSGNTLFDLSGNNRNFTGDGSYITAQGIKSGATWTCAASDVNSLLDTDFHTIMFVIKFNTTDTNSTGTTGSWNKVFEHSGSSGDRSPGVWRYPSERKLHWTFNPNNTSTNFDTGSGNFALNQYYHICVVKEGSSVRAYVNGSYVLANNSSANPKQPGNSSIKLFPGYPADLANMDFLTIYNTSLSVEEINKNYRNVKGRFGL